MCGFFSTYFRSINLNEDVKDKCIKSLKMLNHRGPDDLSYSKINNNFLGFTRLSIIDEENGKQPMFNKDNSIAILFNGEIFNFRELSDHLRSKNIHLKTNSDTEVLLCMYELYDEKMYEYLRGMFSFVIYNFKAKEIYGARDRYGIKPFYYYNQNQNFIFSSEPKSIRNFHQNEIGINDNKLSEFITFGYSADDKTFYKDINSLPPGHSLKIKNDNLTIIKNWEPFYNHEEEIDINENEASKKLYELFEETINLWLTADVPVASLMSGGIDSSTVTNCAQKYNDIKSFSVIFPDDNDINEQKNIEKIIKYSKNKNFEILKFTENLVYESINKVVNIFDAPINDPNNMTLFALCNKIKKSYNYKVVMCGEGADELFAGYHRHYNFYEKLKNKKNYNDLVLANNYLSIDRLNSIDWNQSYDFEERYDILHNLNSKKLFNKILEFDQKTFLQSRLYCQDMMGMANSIEIRTPFLEHKLAEFINSLPIKLKHNGTYTKYLFRLVSEKYLPKDVSWDKKKIALNIPYSKLLKEGYLKNIFLENINKNSKIKDFCNIDKLLNLFSIHKPNDSKNDHSNTLWRILALELWLKQV